MLKIYCGKKNTPKNRIKGTSNQCFLLGRKAGYVGGVSKGIVELSQPSLNTLTKDIIRAIAQKFNVTGYSKMNKDELIRNILRLKKTRKTFNLQDFKKK
jgi:hypothetical protein